MQDIPTSWLIIGFIGQALFSMRFLVQWIHSEKHKKSKSYENFTQLLHFADCLNIINNNDNHLLWKTFQPGIY